MKVAFVLPRYGPTVVGGAETAARALAEGLANRSGWDVEVLTGRAEDFVTWAEVFPGGVETINGVTVRRFDSVAGRKPEFHPFSASLLADSRHASLEDAERWIDLQGPVVPEVTEAAIESDADAVVFFPYLYYPTVRAIERVRAATLLHPAAHDEPALYLPVFPPVFESATGLVFQTTAERDLVQRTFPVATHHQILLGLGVDDPDPLDFDRSRSGPPYLLCLGRVEDRKGSSLLCSLFSAYKVLRPGPLRLVFAGPVVEALPDHPEIDVLGPVSEEEKWSLLSGATALVSPSAWEAFSLVIIEAWSARTPVLVNGACAATVEHCRRSAAGMSFSNFGEFAAVVDRLVDDPRAAALLGERGRSYVDRWFRWPKIVDRYATFIEATVAAYVPSDA